MLPADFHLTQLLLPLGLFGMCSMMAWLAANHWLGQGRTAEQRLQYLRRVGLADGYRRDAARAKRSAVARWLEKASPHLAKPFQPSDTLGVGKLRLRLSHAGFTSESASSIFLACKVTSLLLGLVVGGGMLLFTAGLNASSVIRAAVIALVTMFLPDVILYLLASRRKTAIFLALPDALDLMVACVEAGLGLDQAMRRVAEEMATSHPIIAREFGLANLQLQMGINRTQVLRDLATRNGEEDLNSFCSLLIQAARLGSSIGQALRVHSDAMRTRRRQLAEEKAAKCAVKLIFPLVLFIFPGIFVVLVGPAAVSILRNLLPAMGGGG